MLIEDDIKLDYFTFNKDINENLDQIVIFIQDHEKLIATLRKEKDLTEEELKNLKEQIEKADRIQLLMEEHDKNQYAYIQHLEKRLCDVKVQIKACKERDATQTKRELAFIRGCRRNQKRPTIAQILDKIHRV